MQYDSKLGFEVTAAELRAEMNYLDLQKRRLIEEIDAIPKLGGCLAKLFSLDDDDNNSVEEIQLLIDTIIKTGGIRAAIKKLNNNSTSYNKAVALSDNDKICAKYNKSKEGVMPTMYQVYATADDSDDNTIT